MVTFLTVQAWTGHARLDDSADSGEIYAWTDNGLVPARVRSLALHGG